MPSRDDIWNLRLCPGGAESRGEAGAEAAPCDQGAFSAVSTAASSQRNRRSCFGFIKTISSSRATAFWRHELLHRLWRRRTACRVVEVFKSRGGSFGIDHLPRNSTSTWSLLRAKVFDTSGTRASTRPRRRPIHSPLVHRPASTARRRKLYIFHPFPLDLNHLHTRIYPTFSSPLYTFNCR